MPRAVLTALKICYAINNGKAHHKKRVGMVATTMAKKKGDTALTTAEIVEKQ
ncbi:MAG: hypothetical protein KME08_20405 [Aphanothece sp. CMT-3BRIN-NPC111]|nr:hypothetical protein [Aphanothece sp. CMT-3BRIN-NPC111]